MIVAAIMAWVIRTRLNLLVGVIRPSAGHIRSDRPSGLTGFTDDAASSGWRDGGNPDAPAGPRGG